MMQDVNPTRAELLVVKTRIKLAESGHKILKKKRDGLIMEFYAALKDAKNLRGELNILYQKAHLSMIETTALEGVTEIKSLSLALKDRPSVDLEIRNVMGVKIPQIKKGKIRKSMEERGYGLLSSSMRMDEMAQNYEELLEKALDVAEVETKLRRLLIEIEKTKRRVNSLEYIVIPRLDEQRRFIAMRLEEMDRETTFRMKKIKQRMQTA